MNLICFEFGVMISIWVLLRFWYDLDMILIRFWYGSSELASNKETETAQGQVFGRVFKCFYGFGMILIWFWYDFDTILIRFWYGFDMVPVSWLQKKTETAQGQVFGRFFAGFCGFDFDTILIWFWYDFWIFFGYGSDGLVSNHKFDPHQKT